MNESEARRNTLPPSSPLDEITIAGDSTEISEHPEFDSGICSSAGTVLDLDLDAGRGNAGESTLADGLNWRDEVASRVEKFRKRRGSSRSQRESGSNLDFDFGAVAEPELESQSERRPQRISFAEGHFRSTAGIKVRGGRSLGNDRQTEGVNEPPREDSSVPPVRSTIHVDTRVRPEEERNSEDRLQDGASTVDRDEFESFEPATRASRAASPQWGDETEDKADNLDGQAEPEGIAAAPIGRRFLAGLIDGGILILCGGLFALIFSQAGGRIPHGVLAEAIFAFIALVFTTAYFSLFTAMSGTTPGLETLGMRISRPDGRMPSPHEALMRALGYLFSSAALMMGFLWAMVDSDGLTWHDRMSDTLVTTAPLPPEGDGDQVMFAGSGAHEVSW